jgi:hypothetical protein
MAKVRSERDLVDNGIRALVDAWAIAERPASFVTFRRAMAITSRLRKSSSKECVWTRYIKRPASIIPASRFDSSPRILPGSTDILTHFDVSRIPETRKFPLRVLKILNDLN